MSHIHVERATLDELPAIWEIDAQITDTDANRAALMEAVQNRHVLVAKQGFTVLGFGVRANTFFGFPFISLLATRPDHRRQGVARALLAYIEKTTPVDRLFTSADESDRVALDVLQAFSFRRSGTVYNVNRTGDAEIIFVKMLT